MSDVAFPTGATPARGGTDREPGLDVIRVACIAAVISLLHAIGYIERAIGVRIDFGDGVQSTITALALGMVTIVSGYVIGYRYPDLSAAGAAKRFMTRRLVRLYPLYACALVVFWLAWFRDMSPGWVVAQFLCVGVLISGFGLPVVATIYYVQIIFICYALYAFVVVARGNARIARFVLVVVCLLVWCALLGFGNNRVLLYAPLFAVGAAWSLSGRGRASSWPLLVSCTLGAFVSAGLLLRYADVAPYWVVHALMTTLAASAFLPSWWIGDVIGVFAPKTIGVLAYASLPAFLFHRPVLSAIDNLVSVSGRWQNAMLFSVFGTALSFGVGLVLQSAYDAAVARLRRAS